MPASDVARREQRHHEVDVLAGFGHRDRLYDVLKYRPAPLAGAMVVAVHAVCSRGRSRCCSRRALDASLAVAVVEESPVWRGAKAAPPASRGMRTRVPSTSAPAAVRSPSASGSSTMSPTSRQHPQRRLVQPLALAPGQARVERRTQLFGLAHAIPLPLGSSVLPTRAGGSRARSHGRGHSRSRRRFQTSMAPCLRVVRDDDTRWSSRKGFAPIPAPESMVFAWGAGGMHHQPPYCCTDCGRPLPAPADGGWVLWSLTVQGMACFCRYCRTRRGLAIAITSRLEPRDTRAKERVVSVRSDPGR